MNKFFLVLTSIIPLMSMIPATSAQNNFNTLEDSVRPIEQYIDVGVTGQGSEGVRDFIIDTFYDVAFPLVLGIGILFAIIGGYRLLFSDEEGDRDIAIRYIIRGIIGIILIMSARYITFVLVGETGTSGLMFTSGANSFDGVLLAQGVYDQIVYPFINIIFMVIVGLLFVLLLIRLFSFLFSADESIRSKSVTIILRNTIGILLIIGAKTIVEAIYGTREQVVAPNAGQNLSEIGSGILTDTSLPLLYTIINRVMGITSLLILFVIIYQAYILLTNPDDESKLSSVGKSLGYIFAGIVVIGLGYVITNVFLIQ